MGFPIAAGIGLGVGALGSLFGGTNYKAPSAEDLRRMFGPGALAGDQAQLYRMLASSPAAASGLHCKVSTSRSCTAFDDRGSISSSFKQTPLFRSRSSCLEQH